MNVNFSIPVTLYDYRQSDNSLYSFAKLKIFYVGMTPDKRLFTKTFSDDLLKSLPYVPVVGYYNDETEDFVGHNPKVQHIYGVVPETTGREYVEEGDKTYAVCDVILYTGRYDKTGEIAQKIVGKSHSLELNPTDTKYKVNKTSDGEIKNIEFLKGSLIGLSVLGDGEKPAFNGSEFFNESSKLEEIFENLKIKAAEFMAHINQRGEAMDTDTTTTVVEEINQEIVSESPAVTEQAIFEENLDENEVVKVNENNNTEDFKFSTKEETLIKFMRVTMDEVEKSVLEQFYNAFGENVYVVQWSAFDNIIVYIDFSENMKYYRVGYEMNSQTERLSFGEKIAVRPRFLTDEEIDALFPANFTGQEEIETNNIEQLEQSQVLGTEQIEQEAFSSIENTLDGEKIEENTKETVKTTIAEEQNFSTISLTDSERAELDALRKEVNEYRRIKKIGLIEDFEGDLSKEFIAKLSKEVDNYSQEQLETVLAKEFTKIQKEQQNKASKRFTPFIINGKNESTNDPASVVKRLVEEHK